MTNAGEELRYDTIWKSGMITDNEASVLKANVNGPGTVSFWWRVSSEKFRDLKLDHLEFAVDGVPREPWINGETKWQYMEVEVDEAGEHVLTWTYAKDEEGAAGEDCGRVCAVVWTPRMETLADYLNCTNLTFATSGDAGWNGDVATNHDGVASLKSGAIDDGGKSVVETMVEGTGKVSFWWKVSSETFRKFQVDYVAFYVDDDEKAWIGGEVGWTNVFVSVEGAGPHILKWVYQKDPMSGTWAGCDCAWLDEVAWEPATVPVGPIPDLGDEPTEEQIADALGDSADEKLAENITDGATYNDYRDWAETIGPQTVKDSPNAWVSFALGQDALLEMPPTDEDLSIEAFEPALESGKFDFTVGVKDIDIGSEAAAENLKKVFGLEGGSSLQGLTSDNVDITFGTPENGKVKFTAGPNAANAGATTFFMKVKLAP